MVRVKDSTATMTIHSTAVDASLRSNSGKTRRLVPADVASVADLHRRAFNSGGSESEYRQFFSDVFLDDVASASGICSLVYEDSDGAIIGFQGLRARRM